MRMPSTKSALLLSILLLSSIYGSITTIRNNSNNSNNSTNSNMHLIKTTPLATTIKHGKKNLHQLAKAIRPWVYSKKKLARDAANSAMMEFHEQPSWNRLTFPEPKSDDDGKSWYKGDEKKFMSRGSLLSDINTDDDQESWYEGDEKFFDIKDMPPLNIGFTGLLKCIKKSLVSIKLI